MECWIEARHDNIDSRHGSLIGELEQRQPPAGPHLDPVQTPLSKALADSATVDVQSCGRLGNREARPNQCCVRCRGPDQRMRVVEHERLQLKPTLFKNMDFGGAQLAPGIQQRTSRHNLLQRLDNQAIKVGAVYKSANAFQNRATARHETLSLTSSNDITSSLGPIQDIRMPVRLLGTLPKVSGPRSAPVPIRPQPSDSAKFRGASRGHAALSILSIAAPAPTASTSAPRSLRVFE